MQILLFKLSIEEKLLFYELLINGYIIRNNEG